MFVGHLAVSLGAKVVEPRVPLSVLVAASFGLDLLWPLLLVAGIETVRVAPGDTSFTPLEFESYPWSHSLLLVLVWGGAAWLLAYRIVRNQRASFVVAVVLVSHWVLDFVTHRPDLPLWPAGPKVGLGLWNSVPATILLEGALFAAAITMYARSQRPIDGIGKWAFWALVALTTIIWIAQPWSPPPPDASAVAIAGMLMWLLPWWASWIDRHRTIDGAA
jgi:membrane-bound metal-dependent hydrolase YbcI (DUF457 family)